MSQPIITDYRKHYRNDAEFIQSPENLSLVRFASERRRFQVSVRQIEFTSETRVIDIGCGSGWLASECAKAGGCVTATDIALTGVSIAQRRFPEDVCYSVADLYDMPMLSASFEVAILSEVLEHVERLDDALQEVKRLLVPGGHLIITVPFRETIVQHLCIHCNHPTPSNAHLHSFDTEGLTALLQKHGLGVEKMCFLNNKLLELLRFPRITRRWPYWAWRTCDRLLNYLVGRPAFVLVVVKKPSA